MIQVTLEDAEAADVALLNISSEDVYNTFEPLAETSQGSKTRKRLRQPELHKRNLRRAIFVPASHGITEHELDQARDH